MKRPILIAYGILFALAGAFLVGPAVSEPQQHMMHSGSAQHKMMQHGKKEQHRYRGGHHGKAKLFGPHWKETLTDEQKAQIDQMHVDFAKAKMPLKTRVKALKVDLAVLATTDNPNTAAIEMKINEILSLKQAIMLKRYAHIAEMREVLTTEQRLSFDMDVLNKAKHKRGKHH